MLTKGLLEDICLDYEYHRDALETLLGVLLIIPAIFLDIILSPFEIITLIITEILDRRRE